ncbi:MAG: hypothetical protein M3O82_07345, partial [Verrucomicrobiota bacterium]|nr:hypothetical protein [Verrucomicrobiota bacterium]
MSWDSSQRQRYRDLENRVIAGMNGEMSAEVFNQLAVEIYHFQREHNKSYRNYCDYVGAPALIGEWRQIPAVPQSAFKTSALRVYPAEETIRTFRTSGTTGEGYGSHHFCSLRAYDASIVAGWRYLGIPLVRRLIFVPSAK